MHCSSPFFCFTLLKRHFAREKRHFTALLYYLIFIELSLRKIKPCFVVLKSDFSKLLSDFKKPKQGFIKSFRCNNFLMLSFVRFNQNLNEPNLSLNKSKQGLVALKQGFKKILSSFNFAKQGIKKIR